MMWTLTLGLTLTPMKASPDGYAQGQPRASPPPAGIKDVTARRRGAPTSVSTKRLIARYGTPSYWPENLRIRGTIPSAAFSGGKTGRTRPETQHREPGPQHRRESILSAQTVESAHCSSLLKRSLLV